VRFLSDPGNIDIELNVTCFEHFQLHELFHLVRQGRNSVPFDPQTSQLRKPREYDSRKLVEATNYNFDVVNRACESGFESYRLMRDEACSPPRLQILRPYMEQNCWTHQAFVLLFKERTPCLMALVDTLPATGGNQALIII
jgi:hypothetical protein